MVNEKHGFSGKIVNGLIWVACGKGAQVLLQFLVLVILARLITPKDFGIVGAAMIIIGFSEIITELGLGAAVVQREKLEQRHLDTAFFSSVIFTLAAGLIIFLASPLIALFFNSTEIEPVLKTLSLLFPIRGIATVGDALAQRELRFRWLAKRDTFAFGVGYIIFGVCPAFLGFGFWSLVTANLAVALIKTSILLFHYPPRGWRPELKAFRELIYFGGGHTIARITNYGALQGDNLVVGRVLGLSALGIYGRAYQLMSVPASVFGQVLDRVLFPSMAKIQNQRERLAETYLSGINLVALVMLPVSIGGFILAPEIVGLLLGDQWTSVIWPFRILLIGLLMRTSYKLSDSLARATGAVYRRAWRQAIYAGMIIGGAWFGHFWGVSGVAVGVLAALLINFLLMAQMSLSIIQRGWNDFFATHVSALKLAATYGLIIYPTVYFLRLTEFSDFFILILTAVVSAVFLFLIIKFAPLFFLGKEAVRMLNLLQSYLPENLRLKSLTKNEKPSISTIGVKDADIKGAS